LSLPFFGRGHRMYLSWSRWIQTISRIACPCETKIWL